jgi:hypothetical protein
MVRRAGLVKRLLLAALAVWLGRWAAQEIAAYAAGRWLPSGPPPIDSPRPPGRMPGPFDR